MWKVLARSAVGTSHACRAVPCQDACTTAVVGSNEGPVLVLAAADGAGTGAHSEVGSRIACEELLRSVSADLVDGLAVSSIDRDLFVAWFNAARTAVLDEAARREVKPRELASTALLAVVSPTSAAFAQLGDGAIVIRDGEAFPLVFWPQSGEYANTTFFLTEDDFGDNLSCETRHQPVHTLAVLTDGLQRLALDYSNQTGHPGFFSPLFSRLEQAGDAGELDVPLSDFLASERVNGRTDDDKTLILATRVPTSGFPTAPPY